MCICSSLIIFSSRKKKQIIINQLTYTIRIRNRWTFGCIRGLIYLLFGICNKRHKKTKVQNCIEFVSRTFKPSKLLQAYLHRRSASTWKLEIFASVTTNGKRKKNNENYKKVFVFFFHFNMCCEWKCAWNMVDCCFRSFYADKKNRKQN